MEKPKRKETITIKMNHEEQETDNNDSTFSREEEHKENPIEWHYLPPDVNEETAATNNAQEDEFDWILPDEKEYPLEEDLYTPPKKKALKKKKRNFSDYRSFIPLALTVFFAILVGTSLGFFILNIFINDSLPDEVVTAQPEETIPIEEPSSSDTYSLTVQPISTFVVQGGAFQTAEGAQLEESKMKNLGIPSKTVTKGDTTYLFIGIANSLENAKFIGAELQEQGIETYAKEDSFGGVTLENLTDSERQLLEFFPDAHSLLTNILSLYMINGSITEMLKDSFHHLETAWGNLSVIEKESLQQLKQEIDSAMAATIEFEQTKSQNHLISLQQHLLNALAIYHTLQ